MLPKSKIKVVQSLKHKKNRINSNLFLVEGIKSFDELLKSNYKIEFTIISKETLANNKHYKNLKDLYVVSSAEINKLSGLKNNKSLVSVVHKKNQKKESIDFSNLIIALDSVNDPGNLGNQIFAVFWNLTKKDARRNFTQNRLKIMPRSLIWDRFRIKS